MQRIAAILFGLVLLSVITVGSTQPFQLPPQPHAQPAPNIERYTPAWWSLDDALRRAQRAESTRQEAVGRVLEHEGGYANKKADPGGPTNYGVTQATARRYGYHGPMRDFTMEQAVAVYEHMWDAHGFGSITDAELAIQAFDAYVAHGPRALAWIPAPGPHACERLNQRRLGVYQRSANWSVFGRGWGKRIQRNIQMCRIKQTPD